MSGESRKELFNLTIADILETCYGPDNAKKIMDEIVEGYEGGKEGEELQEHIKEVVEKYEATTETSSRAAPAAGVVVVPVVVSPTPLH